MLINKNLTKGDTWNARQAIFEIHILPFSRIWVYQSKQGLPMKYIVKARRGSETSVPSNIAFINCGGVVPPVDNFFLI